MRYVFNMLNSLVKIRVRLAVLNKSALTFTTQLNLVLRACSLRRKSSGNEVDRHSFFKVLNIRCTTFFSKFERLFL